MCSIYVINVGANTSHSSQARSPIFNGNSFVFVSFCTERGEDNPTAYPQEMLPFTHPHKQNLSTHNDPDWCNMTYGDIYSGRGAALKNVIPGDILLFWGLLYRNECPDWKSCIAQRGACWTYFSSPLDDYKGWYLLGAMRVKKIVVGGHTLGGFSPEEHCRIRKNAHFMGNRIPTNHRIFLGDKDKKYSRLFDKAIKLWVPETKPKCETKWKNSLLYRTFRASDGRCLSLDDSPRWYSSVRTCRKMWDLSDSEQRKLAGCVRDAIKNDNKDFDLLKDARC